MNRRLAALDFICDCLALDRSLERNDSLRATIARRKVDWTSVVQIANDELLSPAFWVALRTRDLALELPSGVREYLSELHRLNLDRNLGLKTQALEAVRALNAIGVVPILLKGTATLFSPAYDDRGSRIMLDLDILVPNEKALACWDRLCELGYVPIGCERDFSGHHHLEPLQRPGAYGIVEIHRDALPDDASRLLSTERIWTHSAQIDDAGVAMRVPDVTAHVALNIIHSAVAHGGYQVGSGFLRSLHELALTADRHNADIGWPEIRDNFRRDGKARILDAWLYLSYRMFDSPKPEGPGATASALGYFARYRLQARSRWADETVKRLSLFSARSIAERYGCDNRFLALNAGRLRLLREISRDYARRAARSGWQSLFRTCP